MKKFLLAAVLSATAVGTALVVRQVLKDTRESDELWKTIVDEIGTDKLGTVRQA